MGASTVGFVQTGATDTAFSRVIECKCSHFVFGGGNDLATGPPSSASASACCKDGDASQRLLHCPSSPSPPGTPPQTCRLPRRQQQQQDAPGSVNRASINSTSNILAAAARVSPASCIHNISSGGKGVAKCVRFLLEEAIQATADCGDASASAEHDAAADPTPSGPWGRGGELGGSWGYNLGAALQQAQRGAEGQEAAEDAGKEEKAEENAAADADRVSPGQWGRGGELGCSYGRTLGSVLRAAQCGGNNTHQEGVAAGKATTVPHYMLPTASSLLKVADRVGANKANKAAQPSPARRVVRPWR